MQQPTNKQFDLGFLTLFDSNPLFSSSSPPPNFSQLLLQTSISNISHFALKLITQLTTINTKRDQLPQQLQLHDFNKSQLLLKLPSTTTQFPRARKLPSKKEETKWEKFAKEKGIKNQKKGGMVYDEETRKYIPRWGGKSKKNFEPAIMEEKERGVDPFKERENSKKLRVEKQKLREHKNRGR